jgi:molecular chaperone Hsp33
MGENPTIGLVKHQDLVQPFMLHNSIVRGRMVRLDDTLNEILSAHQYPETVALLLAELLLLSSMLATQLPEGGILTLQIKTDGAVSFMVCDVLHNGGVRGYANVIDVDAINDGATMQQILGRGYLAITLDTTYGEPYQGIVPLEGESLSDAVAHYFSQSQQLHVLFRNYVGKMGEKYIASGIMLERMPDMSFENAEFTHDTNDAQNWDYYKLLLATATKIELTDLYLAPSALLYRLFNEGGVWVYDTHKISKNCRCSREKIIKILGTMPEAELVEMQVDGAISVVCQFCNREELFTLAQLKTYK